MNDKDIEEIIRLLREMSKKLDGVNDNLGLIFTK
jgi:hypothetical protein